MMNKVIGIIGVGLIGGSIGAALRRNGEVVIGYDQNHNAQSGDSACVERFTDSVTQLAEESTIIIIATPIGSLPDILNELKTVSDLHTKIVSDVSSIKQKVVDMTQVVFGEIPSRFVFGHPIAGSENSGAEFARADLFTKQTVILNPLPSTDPVVINEMMSLWQSMGAEVVLMDCATHDKKLAMTSHLPHVLAYSLMHYLCSTEQRDDLLRYSAGGFQDFTRIAASDPDMWRDICTGNRENILAAIEGFQADLQHLSKLLKDNDAEAIQQFFLRAHKYKKQFGK